MPLGLIFGALFFGGFCAWVGLGLILNPIAAAKLAGASMTVAGLSLGAGLLLRRPWARWAGTLAALLTAAFGMQLVSSGSGVLEHVLLLGSFLAAALLLVPATGDPRRGAARPVTRSEGGATRWLGALALAGLAGWVGSAVWWVSLARPGEPLPAAAARGSAALPRAALARSIEWTDFAHGVQRARAESKPMLVTFFTTWCPYCKKMEGSTWHAAPVVERLGDVVPVRVDAEDQSNRGGYVGEQLAQRYGVRGFPAQFLLDADGRVLSRADGYMSPGELIQWLDRSVGHERDDKPRAALREPRS